MKKNLDPAGQNSPVQDSPAQGDSPNPPGKKDKEVPRLVYDLWPEAGQMLGLTRNATYEAAKRGEIPVIRIGKLLRVPKAAFDRMLEAAGAR
jgi:excisionase family DNA binding protein